MLKITLNLALLISMYLGQLNLHGQTAFRSDSIMQIQINDSIHLGGTLNYATNEKLVIFIAGSGPTDRDCNNAAGLKTDAFKLLADTLKDVGISSFRYDKRGIGTSTPIHEKDLSIDDLIYDASFLVDYFSDQFEEIYIFGHSEGALIGAAATNQNPKIKALISTSGISNRFDSLLIEQISKYPKLVDMTRKHIQEINSGDTLSEVHPLLRSLFRESVVPYLRSAFALDPIEEISKINQDVLIVNGTCDIQVPQEHAQKLSESVENGKLVIIENMGHTLKKLNETCSNNMLSYSDPTMPLHPELVEAVTQFVLKP